MSDGGSVSIFRRNVTWQFVASASQAALGGLVLLVMGRQLEAHGFGHYSIIMGFVYVANLLMEPRMQDVAAKQFWNFDLKPESREEHRSFFVDFFVFEATAKLLPCAVLVLLSGKLAAMAKLPPGGEDLITIAAVGTYFAKLGYGLSTGLLRVLGRSDQFTFCSTGELVLRLALMLALVRLSGLTVANSIVALCLAGIITNAAQLVLAATQIRGLPGALRTWRPFAAVARLRQHRRLLLSNVGLSASDLMNKDLDVTMLSPIMPAAQIGVYKMAKSIALLAWRAVDPFYLALMPELIRRVQMMDYIGTRVLLRRSSLGLFALAACVSASAYLTVAYLGEALIGPAFASVPQVISWMLVGVIGSAPLVWGHPLAVALNRADVALTGSLLGLVVGLCAFVILVAFMGIRGAAISWSLTFLPCFIFTAAVAHGLFRRRTLADDRAARK